MPNEVDLLIEDGCSGIAIVAHDRREESSGYQDEHETTVLVARRGDGRPVRVTFETHTKFSPRGGTSTERRAEPISEGHYQAALAAHSLRDTDEYRTDHAAKKAEEAEARAASTAAQAKFDALRPKCAVCSKPLIARFSAKNKGYFWGCKSFPKCKGTRSMDAATQALARKGAK